MAASPSPTTRKPAALGSCGGLSYFLNSTELDMNHAYIHTFCTARNCAC